MTYRPLDGIRVLEWARDFPGPHTGRKLADMGADVVKLSDMPRELGGPARSQYATEWRTVLDRNKRSAAFDFTLDEDRNSIRRLAETADVLLEGSRPGGFTAKTGITFGDIREANPKLVICSVSGFGQSGLLVNKAAHGLMLESLSYCLYPQDKDGHWVIGQESNVTVAVEIGPINAAFAIVSALWNADKTGKGVWIDVSCWDAAVEVHRHRMADVLNGREPWYDTPNSGARYAVYDAGDGRPIFFGAGDPHFWANFCRHVDREDLISVGRSEEDNTFLRGELEKIFLSASASEWNDRFTEWNVAGSDIVMSLEEMAAHPNLEARKMISDLPGGDRMLADPIRWVDSDSRPGEPARLSEGIGAETDAVLSDWLSSGGQVAD
jgi:alpha-methylacyl-CoA racemase